MKNIQYNGIPSIQGKRPDEALDILYRHCDDVAKMMMKMNREIEDLKDEVEMLRMR